MYGVNERIWHDINIIFTMGHCGSGMDGSNE